MAGVHIKTLLQLKGQYDNLIPAQGLFFARFLSPYKIWQRSVRIQAPGIRKEFTDKVILGGGLDGWLYYNTLLDLDSTKTSYKVTLITNSDGSHTGLVKFFHHTEERCYAEYITNNSKITQFGFPGLDGFSSSGNWGTLEITSVTAHVHMHSDDEKITITAPGVEKKAIIPGATDLFKHGLDVWGTLTFKNINDLSRGTFADYNPESITFRRTSHWSNDFIAFFIPSPISPLGALGTVTQPFDDVSWSDDNST